MDKHQRYASLVKKRKECNICNNDASNKLLFNGNDLQHMHYITDNNDIGQWSVWHGDLNADILLIGKDWGDYNSYIKFKNFHIGDFDEYCKTNTNLRELFRCIDGDIDIYKKSGKVKLFFTNSILCYKDGKMAEKTKQIHHNQCSGLFLIELIRIIQPKIIITLGENAFRGLISCIPYIDILLNIQKSNYKDIVNNGSLITKFDGEKILIFPVIHPSPLGIANKSFVEQKMDWARIGEKARELKLIY